MRVLSFNIRADLARDRLRGRSWRRRRSAVIETVRAFGPEIIGFQEVRRRQRADLIAAFPDHEALGGFRAQTRTAEAVPLFIDRRSYEVEASGDLWLSPTPDVEASRGWDAAYPRICTWAQVRAREHGFRFVVCNAHFDHRGEGARVESAKLLAQHVREVALPVILLGDLNATPDSAPLQILAEAGLRDAFAELHPADVAAATVQGSAHAAGARVDHILCDDAWQILGADIIFDPRSGPPPSDHRPVGAILRPR